MWLLFSEFKTTSGSLFVWVCTMLTSLPSLYSLSFFKEMSRFDTTLLYFALSIEFATWRLCLRPVLLLVICIDIGDPDRSAFRLPFNWVVTDGFLSENLLFCLVLLLLLFYYANLCGILASFSIVIKELVLIIVPPTWIESFMWPKLVGSFGKFPCLSSRSPPWELLLSLDYFSGGA